MNNSIVRFDCVMSANSASRYTRSSPLAFHFAYLGDAAKWVGGNRENVGRCCRCNEAKKVCKHDWRPGQAKGASRINTDHKYMGIRFYFESDNVWTTKIKV